MFSFTIFSHILWRKLFFFFPFLLFNLAPFIFDEICRVRLVVYRSHIIECERKILLLSVWKSAPWNTTMSIYFLQFTSEVSSNVRSVLFRCSRVPHPAIVSFMMKKKRGQKITTKKRTTTTTKIPMRKKNHRDCCAG